MSDSLRPHGPYSPRNSPGQNTGVGSRSLLQGIFPTQGSNSDLPHCGRILHQLSHQMKAVLFAARMNCCLGRWDFTGRNVETGRPGVGRDGRSLGEAGRPGVGATGILASASARELGGERDQRGLTSMETPRLPQGWSSACSHLCLHRTEAGWGPLSTLGMLRGWTEGGPP